jgi:hypothetical protein
LNGVFLAAFAFGRDPLAFWTLVAYASSGPLLLGIMRLRGGLTGLLGLAHLFPSMPLLAYLVARLSTSAAGPTIVAADDPALFAYAVVLIAAVGACLALDLWDVARWFRGERCVLGTHAAYRRRRVAVYDSRLTPLLMLAVVPRR